MFFNYLNFIDRNEDRKDGKKQEENKDDEKDDKQDGKDDKNMYGNDGQGNYKMDFLKRIM
jgi:hypothetical protein